MALRKILVNDPILRSKSRPVDDFSQRLFLLLDDMLETMRSADGVGLAAVQVGVLRRAVVVEAEPGNPIELINPVIVSSEGIQDGSEGCLSFPGKYGEVIRPKKVTVRAQNRFGKFFEITGEDLMARAFCHELDHLDGKVIPDYAKNFGESTEGKKRRRRIG